MIAAAGVGAGLSARRRASARRAARKRGGNPEGLAPHLDYSNMLSRFSGIGPAMSISLSESPS